MTKWIRYEFVNIEPLRIADDSTSQSGQTCTLRYVPGTTIRGYVINRLAKKDGFEEMSSMLLSDHVRFLNAFPMINGRELIPSPKGFYEDKTVEVKKEIQSVVVDGSFSEGCKRAALGQFSYLEGDCVFYHHVDTGADMKIKINLSGNEKQNVFRNEHMIPGNTFAGYIAIDDEAGEAVAAAINGAFEPQFILGNGRSAGLGKCRLVNKSVISQPDIRRGPLVSKKADGKLYMMLLSHTVMRDERGVYAGLNLKTIEKKFGVTNLTIAHCSTGIVNVRGYNRTMGIKLPSVAMYEQGSVFKFTFTGSVSAETLNKVMAEGIGIRKNEGFGQIIFLDEYEKLAYKQQGEDAKTAAIESKKMPADEAELKQIAASYYRYLINEAMQQQIVELQHGGISSSQIGNVEAIILANRYDFDAAADALNRFFGHKSEKEEKQKKQKENKRIGTLEKQVRKVLDKRLCEVLGLQVPTIMGDQVPTIMGVRVDDLLSAQDEGRMKLDYLTKLIRYENRKED